MSNAGLRSPKLLTGAGRRGSEGSTGLDVSRRSHTGLRAKDLSRLMAGIAKPVVGGGHIRQVRPAGRTKAGRYRGIQYLA